MTNKKIMHRCYKELKIEAIKLEVTQKCNSRCMSCITWRMPQESLTKGEAVGREMTFEEHVKLVDELSDLGCKYIELHGGEPTLYKKLPELVEYCTSKGISTFFSTNGLAMTEALAEKLVKAGLGRINFSLDGPRECHNKLRGREDAFDKQMHAIECMRKADPHETVFRTFNTNVSTLNIDRAEEVVEIAAEQKVSVINYIHPTLIEEDIADQANAIFGEHVASHRIIAAKELQLKDAKLVKLKRKEIKEKAKNYKVKLPRTKLFTLSPDEVVKGVKREKGFCADIYGYCTIDAFGNVFPCEILRYKLGNILEQTVEEIYTSERFEQFTKTYSENINNLDICKYCVDTVHEPLSKYFL